MDDIYVERLRATLIELTHEVLTEREVNLDLTRLARLTVALIPQASGASIAMLIDDVVSTRAFTDRVTFELDVVQYSTDQGPCMDALQGKVVRVGFLPTDVRFRHFAVGAGAEGVLSMLSTPIFHRGEVVGTLNLYSLERDAFGAEDERIALVVAAEAAIVIATSFLFEHAHDLRSELQHEHDEFSGVSQAQGVLMAVQEVSAEQALRLLHSAASSNGERLIQVAQRILDAAAQRRELSDSDPMT